MTLLNEKTVSHDPDAAPATRRWTVQEYQQMAEMGFFADQRVELIDGVIVAMAPMLESHVAAVTRLSAILFRLLDQQRYWIRIQSTLKLGDHMPEPDLAIAGGPPAADRGRDVNPLLVIEVSDTTLRTDRGKKMSLYAASRVPEYWVVNLQSRLVEVYTRPIQDQTHPFGWRYADVKTYGASDRIPLQLAEGAQVPVAEFIT
jgi:Uma2 family endonuclease